MIIAYTPLATHDRRRSSKLHFTTGGQYTECGVRVEQFDGTCLGDMELDEALEQQDTCKRCIRSMRSNDHT